MKPILTKDGMLLNNKGILETPSFNTVLKKSIGLINSKINNNYLFNNIYKLSNFNDNINKVYVINEKKHSYTLIDREFIEDNKKVDRISKFIPIDNRILYEPKTINLLNKYREYFSPKNYTILNLFDETPYSINDIKYTFDKYVLCKNEKETEYKHNIRIVNSIIFSCFIDIFLDIVSKITNELIKDNLCTIIIGGIATRKYSIEHYTNDIDIKIFPINSINYKGLNINEINSKIKQIILNELNSIDIVYVLYNYLLLLENIETIKTNSSFKDLKNNIFDMLINSNKMLISVAYIQEKDLTKVVFKLPNGQIIKLMDINYFNLNDVNFQKIQRIINNNYNKTYYSLEYDVEIYENKTFNYQSYRSQLKEKELLLYDILEKRYEFNSHHEYLIEKFKKSVVDLKVKANKRLYIGGYNRDLL